jgi:hypothetical protein
LFQTATTRVGESRERNQRHDRIPLAKLAPETPQLLHQLPLTIDVIKSINDQRAEAGGYHRADRFCRTGTH